VNQGHCPLPIEGQVGAVPSARWPRRGSTSSSRLISVQRRTETRRGGGKDQGEHEGDVLSGDTPTTRTPAACGGAAARRRTGTDAMGES
jgi:hypothetical protein